MIQKISKEVQKRIASLEYKKYRLERGLFLAEGGKLIEELLPFFDCELLLTSENWIKGRKPQADAILVVGEEEIQRCSLQKNRKDVLGLFRIKKSSFSLQVFKNELVLGLDGIQDPGNMGTILRTANWFGIRHIVCSEDSVDVYNPKVVQASMGALGRVQVHYISLPDILRELKGSPIYGTALCGDNLYQTSLTSSGLILMGNEGKGLSQEVMQYVNKLLFIPPYPQRDSKVESLNVAVATSIILSEFRRFQG